MVKKNTNKMKQYLFIFVVLLYGCSSSLLITGEYASRENSNRFSLNSDSTFTYDYKFGHAYEYSLGSWKRVSKKKIVLNSGVKSTVIPLSVQESGKVEGTLNSANFLSINVSIPNTNREDYRCAIFINDNLFQERRCDSLSSILINSSIHDIYFEIRKRPIVLKDLRLSVDPIITNRFLPKSATGNKLQIGIAFSDSLFSYRIFNNEIFKMTKSGIRFYDPKESKWQYIPKWSNAIGYIQH
jgi:hypothetical protein